MPLHAIQAGQAQIGQPSGSPLPGYDIASQYGSLGASNGSPGPPYGSFGTPYTPYGMATQPRRSGKMSGFAIASFIFGLLGGVMFSVVFGFVALRKIQRLGQRGRGLAIAGLVLSGIWIMLIILAIIGANTGKAIRSSTTGLITHSGRINVFSLDVGDCFNNPAGAQTVNTVTAIPCDQPHNAQIYAKFKLTGSDSSYPGAAAVAQMSRDGCNARIGSINKSMTNSAMTVRILLPEEAAWLSGRRTVSCMVVNPKADLTSSLLDSSPATG